MASAVNIALLGYGGIGRVHSMNYRALPFMYPGLIPVPVLHTVVTSREETARAAQREAGFVSTGTSFESAVGDRDVSVVDVSTPNHMHRPAVEAALRAGKHVYCEKPLAGTAADARAIAAAAAGAGGRLGMVFQYRFVPAIVRAKQLIDDGRVGRVYSFRAEYLHSGYQNPRRPLSWRMKKDEGGTGALGDLGSHVIDLVRLLVGEFAEVQGHLETFITERPLAPDSEETGRVTVDDAAWVHARMRNGAVGSIEASRFAVGALDDLRLWIYGEHGALHFNLMDPGFLSFFDERKPAGDYGGERGFQRIEAVARYPDAAAPPGRAPIGWARAHAENQFQFLRALSQDREPTPGVLDGLRAQLVIDSVQRSAADGGAWTPVDLE